MHHFFIKVHELILVLIFFRVIIIECCKLKRKEILFIGKFECFQICERTIHLQFLVEYHDALEDYWRNKIIYPERIRVKNIESVFAAIAQIAIMCFYNSATSEFPS